MNAPEITIDDVDKTFSSPPTLALQGLSLIAPSSTITAIVGMSGSGKSTLLRTIAGLDMPTAGHIDIGGDGPDEARRAKQVGWMSQDAALLPWRTALENISLAQSINPKKDRELPSPEDLLALVGLANFADAHPSALSGGMRQRVSLARTLAVGANVWLMDEPFASLDELTRADLTEDVMAIWEKLRPTVLWVTHSLQEAVKVADRVLLLTPRPGRVSATVDIDMERPRDETSAAFQMHVRRVRGHLVDDSGSRFEATG